MVRRLTQSSAHPQLAARALPSVLQAPPVAASLRLPVADFRAGRFRAGRLSIRAINHVRKGGVSIFFCVCLVVYFKCLSWVATGARFIQS